MFTVSVPFAQNGSHSWHTRQRPLGRSTSFKPHQTTKLGPPADNPTRVRGRNHRLYALHLHQNCADLPPVDDLVARLQRLQDQFQRRGVDMQAPCTHGDPKGCWILRQTSAFNAILQHVEVELKEMEPKRLAISSLEALVLVNLSDYWVFDACILFHLLLKGHRCIKTADLSNSALAQGYPTVLGDALFCNRGLCHLNLSCWELSTKAQHTLAYALCKMTMLETLSADRLIVQPQLAARLADMLARSRTLRVVELLENDMSPTAADRVFQGLCKNMKLRVLRSTDNSLGDAGAEAIGKLLGNASSELEELSLKRVENFSETQVVSIVQPLAVNHCLRTLVLQACCLTPVSGAALVDALAANDTLTTLSLVACNVGHGIARAFATLLEINTSLQDIDLKHNRFDNVTTMALARSLVFNRTLRRLNLERNDIGAEGVILLVDALTKNETLTELMLGYVDVDDDMGSDLSRSLRRAAVYDRVRLSYDAHGVFALSRNIKSHSNRITSVFLESSVDIEASCLKELFAALCSTPCLETLCIEVETCIDGSAARRLSKMLATTTTLRRVQLNTASSEPQAMATVMNGLKVNRSVTHFDVEYVSEKPAITKAFVDMLRANTCLIHFGTLSAPKEELEAIAQGMVVNHVLTSLRIWDKSEFADAIFAVNEVLRRNVSFLNRAVEFAMDPQSFGTRRFPAEVYEQLCRTDSFTALIAKVAGIEAVKRLMLNARRYITANLFAITGISKGPVRCLPRRRWNCTQIDSLNYECWLKICSFLKVTDIKQKRAR
ncbi:unnamed protein product [Ixodes hexagonus]